MNIRFALFVLIVAGCTDDKSTTKVPDTKPAQIKITEKKSIMSIKKVESNPSNSNVGSKANRAISLKDKKWITVVKDEMLIPEWNVKLKVDEKLLSRLKNKSPYVTKKSRWIKYYSETFNENFTLANGSNILNFQLTKTRRSPPKNLTEVSSWWTGEKVGEDVLKKNLFLGFRKDEIRGPGSCGGGRCMHMTIPEISAFVLLPIDGENYVQCSLKWSSEIHSVYALKNHDFFKKLLKGCLSLQLIKKPSDTKK
ncbi:MAG: hypothetical protein JXR95_10560 [Deltaproteobacteria bacterium]|nr:hypothetical protein [Deltaproteobacteria bacterium]